MRTALLTALAVLAASCSSSRSAERPTSTTQASEAKPAPPRDEMAMQGNCPMSVPGTTVSAADTPDGEALTFSTSSGEADELRRRVRAMADMHNQHHAGAEGTGAAPGEGMHMGMNAPPPSQATVEDVDGGARVSVVPKDPAQVEQLRTALRSHAQMMQEHGCAMMMGGHGG